MPSLFYYLVSPLVIFIQTIADLWRYFDFPRFSRLLTFVSILEFCFIAPLIAAYAAAVVLGIVFTSQILTDSIQLSPPVTSILASIILYSSYHFCKFIAEKFFQSKLNQDYVFSRRLLAEIAVYHTVSMLFYMTIVWLIPKVFLSPRPHFFPIPR